MEEERKTYLLFSRVRMVCDYSVKPTGPVCFLAAIECPDGRVCCFDTVQSYKINDSSVKIMRVYVNRPMCLFNCCLGGLAVCRSHFNINYYYNIVLAVLYII